MSTKLRLPLETIERILYYAFEADLPPATLKDHTPSPPPSTSHLLLVSKGFRSISLPFFYRSITIARSHDYFTFFDPEEGLFVNPKDGEDRAKLVKELKVDVGRTSQIPINLPFVMESFDQEEDPERVLIPLGSPKFINLENVSFFQRDPVSDEWIGDDYEIETRESNAGRLIGGDEGYQHLAIDFTVAEEQREWDALSEDEGEPGEFAEEERQRRLEDPDPDWFQQRHEDLKRDREAKFAELLKFSIKIRLFQIELEEDNPAWRWISSSTRRVRVFATPDSSTTTFIAEIQHPGRPYELVGFAPELRAKVVEKLVDFWGEMNAKGQRRTWEEWKWVEEDGTLSPSKPVKPIK